MNIIVGEIRVKRGLKANLPFLADGEPAYCTDTKEYFVGTASGNQLVNGGGSVGGTIPTNVILFEDWAAGESVTIDTATTPPTDTTAPILTITAGGTFTGTKTVTLSANETATIYYTLDSTDPKTSGTKLTYATPLSLTVTTTLKAYAKDAANNESAVQTIVYTLDVAPADTTPPANVSGLQVTGQTASTISLSWTAVSDAASYDIYNGATLLANGTGTTYTATGLSASTQYTLTVKAKDAANNVASGTSVSGTTSAPADTTAPVLTITPAATFTDTQTVTMSANETATIYYTLDDTDPKTSGTKLTYTAPLTLTATDTIKAYARDTAGNESAVQTVTYTKQAGTPVGTIIVADDFNRADASTLGTTPTGSKAWVGGLQIISNQAGAASAIVGANAWERVETSTADNIEISLDVTIPTGGFPAGSLACGITFRFRDANNMYAFGAKSETSVGIYQSGATGVTIPANVTGLALGGTHNYKVKLTGQTVQCYVDDVLKMTLTDTVHFANTQHGIAMYNTAVPKFDNFSIKTI